MGQAQASCVWDSYTSNSNIAPGTYRIIHDGTGKVLQIDEENKKSIVLKDRQLELSDDDHWFILRSGDGYVFKHCREETYLTCLWSTNLGPQPTRATRYPTTWAIHTKNGSDDKCAITIAMERNENWMGGEYVGLIGEIPQKGVCFARLSETEELNQLWRLERVGDETLEEDIAHRIQQLEHLLEAETARWTSSESTIRTMLAELDAKEARLENVRSELATQAMELEVVRDGLSRQAAELKQKYRALGEIRELLDARERAMSEKDKVVSENETIREKDEVSQEEERPSSLRLDETVFVERVPESTVLGETNNVPVSNSTAHVPEPGSQLEIQTQPAALVDQRLTELGWLSD